MRYLVAPLEIDFPIRKESARGNVITVCGGPCSKCVHHGTLRTDEVCDKKFMARHEPVPEPPPEYFKKKPAKPSCKFCAGTGIIYKGSSPKKCHKCS